MILISRKAIINLDIRQKRSICSQYSGVIIFIGTKTKISTCDQFDTPIFNILVATSHSDLTNGKAKTGNSNYRFQINICLIVLLYKLTDICHRYLLQFIFWIKNRYLQLDRLLCLIFPLDKQISIVSIPCSSYFKWKNKYPYGFYKQKIENNIKIY